MWWRIRSRFQNIVLIHEDIYLFTTVEDWHEFKGTLQKRVLGPSLLWLLKGRRDWRGGGFNSGVPGIDQLSEFRCESRERTIGDFGTFWGDAKDLWTVLKKLQIMLNGKYCLKLIYKTFYSKIKVKTFGNDNKIVENSPVTWRNGDSCWSVPPSKRRCWRYLKWVATIYEETQMKWWNGEVRRKITPEAH